MVAAAMLGAERKIAEQLTRGLSESQRGALDAEKISDPAPMISAHLRCPDQWARLDGPAARIAR
jgi:hypothetical protein